MKWLAVDYGDFPHGAGRLRCRRDNHQSHNPPDRRRKGLNKVAAAVTAVAQARGAEAGLVGLPRKHGLYRGAAARSKQPPAFGPAPGKYREPVGGALGRAPHHGVPPRPSWPIPMLSVRKRQGQRLGIPSPPPSFWKAF